MYGAATAKHNHSRGGYHHWAFRSTRVSSHDFALQKPRIGRLRDYIMVPLKTPKGSAAPDILFLKLQALFLFFWEILTHQSFGLFEISGSSTNLVVPSGLHRTPPPSLSQIPFCKSINPYFITWFENIRFQKCIYYSNILMKFLYIR